MILGIDAHNIRGNGGSLIHLKEFLANSNPAEHNFEKIVIWVGEETFKRLPKLEFIEYVLLPKRGFISTLFWQKYNLEKEAKEKKCSLMFFPGGIYLGKFKPFVAFSQSLLPFDHKIRKMYWKTSFYLKLLLKEVLIKYTFNRADGIIFVSEKMKNAVETVMKKLFPNSNIIPHGVSDIFKRKGPKKVKNESEPIKILTVSSHALHKNLISLVNSAAELIKNNINFELYIVGPYTKYGSKQLIKAVDSIDPKKKYIKIIGDVEYEDLPKFYHEADYFVFPSLCESFGMPPYEAVVADIELYSVDNVTTNFNIYNDKNKFFVKCNSLVLSYSNEHEKTEILNKISCFNWSYITNEYFNIFTNYYQFNVMSSIEIE